MGSRKKNKKEVSEQQRFWKWYKSLNLNERISFKQAIWALGRQRYSLQEWVSGMKLFAEQQHQNAVIIGYSWINIY